MKTVARRETVLGNGVGERCWGTVLGNGVGERCWGTVLAAWLIVWSVQAGELILETNFLAGVYDYIEQSEYDIRWVESEAVYKSANRAQNLRFTYHGEGFAFEPRDFGEGNAKPWQVSMRLLSFQKSGAMGRALTNGRWSVSRNAAVMETGEISLEYQNDPSGMRQNFFVPSPPPGDEPLQLNFQLQGHGLTMAVSDSEDHVSFFDQDGSERVRYWDLKVWDAAGRLLDARMVGLSAAHFAIVVDDATATYPILIDPLTSQWVKTESQSGAKFGYSVSGSGQIASGPDPGGIIIGAPYFDTGSYTEAGKVFVYFGVTLPSTPTWTKEGDQAYGRFGWSVACARDVDNNDYDDIIIGAPYYDASSYTDNGKAWIFAGSSSGLGSTALWADDGLNNYAHFGWSVAGIGDVQLDDYFDVIIGAPDYDYSLTDNGGAFVYHGNSSGPGSSYNWSYFGGQNSANLGYSVAAAGDVNGNGYADVIIGAPGASTGGSAKGAAYVFHGASSGLSGTPSTTLWGANAGDKFGFSVAGVLDADGDDIDDVFVGAPYHTNGESNEGKVYLYLGSSSGVDTTADWTAEGNQSGGRFGWSVAGGPQSEQEDILADLIVGAPYYDSTSLSLTDNGHAFLYRSVSGDDHTLDTSIVGVKSYDLNGWSVAFGQVLYRTKGWIVGAPDAHDTGGNLTGGTATVWTYDD